MGIDDVIINFLDAICRHFDLDINVLLDYDEDEKYISAPISQLYGIATQSFEPEQESDLEIEIGDVIQIKDDSDEFWHGVNQRTLLGIKIRFEILESVYNFDFNH